MEYTFNKDTLTTLRIVADNGKRVVRLEYTGTLRENVRELLDRVGLNLSRTILTFDLCSHDTGELLLGTIVDGKSHVVDVWWLPAPEGEVISRELQSILEDVVRRGWFEEYEHYSCGDMVKTLCNSVGQLAKAGTPAEYVA